MIIFLQPKLNIVCGITKTIELLLSNLGKSNGLIVICFGGDNHKLFRNYSKNIKIVKSILGVLLVIIKETRWSSNEKIILHSFHRSFDLLAALISKLSNKFVSITSVQSKVTSNKIVSYKSKQIVACSNAIKSHLVHCFGISPNRIDVVYNFIDTQLIDDSLRKKEINKIVGLNGQLVIGFVGRFDIKEKGIDILLKSFMKIHAKNKNVALLFIGSGKDEHIIIDYKNKYKLPIIIIHSQENVYSYFEKLDILVLPSRVEPFGIVLIEAGYMKKAVIASDVDGISEIIHNGQNGLIFPSGDVRSLTSKLEYISDNRNIALDLADKLHNDVKERFTSEIIIPQYVKLYNRLILNENEFY